MKYNKSRRTRGRRFEVGKETVKYKVDDGRQER
jgi:hypothetical protein